MRLYKKSTQNFILAVIVFCSGAITMVLELVGVRIITPYYGSTIDIWAATLSVVLGSLSIGYWLGGNIADRKADHRTLSFILLFTSLYLGIIGLVNQPILSFIEARISYNYLRLFISLIILFTPPNILLGTIIPYSVKFRTNTIKTSASIAGNLYALSTIGSIAGTILTGFVLIPFLNIRTIFLIVVVVLWVCSLLVFPKILKHSISIVIGLLILYLLLSHIPKKDQNIIMINTPYNNITIEDKQYIQDKKPITIRYLKTDKGYSQSGMYLEDRDELAFLYTRYYRLAEHFYPQIGSALMIGGGAFSYPKYFLKQFPAATLDVVEIDPMMTYVAKQYFYLKDDPRLSIYHEDGRVFINRTKKKYDAVFIDAFHGPTFPFQLSTKEALQKINNILNTNGIVIINLVSAISGEKSKLLRAEYWTYKSIFPSVYLFPVWNREDTELKQNIMLVALKSDNIRSWEDKDPELQRYLKNIWNKEVDKNTRLLTDDYAPVEQYILNVIGSGI